MSRGPGSAVITVAGLTFRYRGGTTALDDVSLSWPPGVVALLGPNGAGKTTLLKLLTGVLPVRTGTVRVASVARAADRNHAVGYLPQSASWPGQFTVTEFVSYLAWARGVPSRHRSVRVRASIADVGLAGCAETRLSRLSGGQHRRAMLAQALVTEPAVLVLDEPTAGFDPVQRVAFRELIAALGTSRTVVVSTHLVEDVEAIAGWVTVLDRGRVAFDGSRADLLRTASPDQARRPSMETQFLRLLR
jgi:ABC-type multidrug transport system ATPase subunit